MNSYKFRPYYAFDCNSTDGFNNGTYDEEIIVAAPNAETARIKAIDSLLGRYNFDTVDRDETGALDVDAAWTFDYTYTTEDGTQYADPADIPTNADGSAREYETAYLYKYLDLGEPELLTEETGK